MNIKAQTILDSMQPCPPVFVPDSSIFRNCYAHALNCMYEDRELNVYTPGLIIATFNESDIYFYNPIDDIYFRDDLFIKLVKRDLFALGKIGICCSFDSNIEDDAYKIALTYSKQDNDFHFLRQNADKTWSHKPGFGSIFHPISSKLIDYRGESKIELDGSEYRVIEIMKIKNFK